MGQDEPLSQTQTIRFVVQFVFLDSHGYSFDNKPLQNTYDLIGNIVAALPYGLGIKYLIC